MTIGRHASGSYSGWLNRRKFLAATVPYGAILAVFWLAAQFTGVVPRGNIEPSTRL
jgi:hypothetical protein